MQLVAEDLIVDRGDRRVIDRLTFSVVSGEALVLLGANGAGKTTLLRTIAGFVRPVSGIVHLEGGGSDVPLGELAHIVGHANAVKSSLTVRENVSFWADYLGGANEAPSSIDAALKHFGLDDLAEFPGADLSAGQKRRLGLTRLIASKRPLWLLDEPTASLDAASSDRLVAAVNTHTASGGIAVVATHLPLALDRARTLELVPTRMAA